MPPNGRKSTTTTTGKEVDIKSIYSAVEKYFKDLGFSPVDKPERTRPTMPPRLSALSVNELSEFCVAYGAWREYTQDLLTMVNAKYALVYEKYRTKRSATYLTFDKKQSETWKKAALDVDEELKPLSEEVTLLETYSTMLETKAQSYSDCLAVLSREITLRTNVR